MKKMINLIPFDSANPDHVEAVKEWDYASEVFAGESECLLIMANEQLIGFTGLFHCVGLPNELKIDLKAEFQNQGFGKVAMKGALDYFFINDPTIDSIKAQIYKENIASYKAAQAAGFIWDDDYPDDNQWLIYTCRNPYYKNKDVNKSQSK